ncbi:Nicotianamine synthase protein [Paracidovorax konjaci]|uniref:Nicotianamine synthase protein n=2 Tax=Paracidovorax konjaci TaxID=32040 RepID=A0A1I1S1U4_9BURK|nr:Nicotianamine synthase protein [Paracidovorax konjaci]
MKPRLDAHKEHVRNDPHRTQAYIPNGLEPCDEVNECLNSLVMTCNEDYSAEEARAVQRELKDISSDLREISNLSEGEMERVALDYIFAVYKDQGIPALDVSANNKEDKTAHLKRIVFDIPNSNKIDGMQESHQFAFPYLDNYDKMAENELRLLTKDSSIPDLKNKTISFVGAGFPLSAIMYHIHSGAQIHLVDIDKGACERAKAFLDICAEANIIHRDDFSVTQGDASKIKYTRKSTSDIAAQASKEMADASELQSDVLVFAAALPSEIKAAALKNVSSLGLDVINRCTSEANNLLYPSTKLSSLQKNYGLENGDRVFTPEKVMYPEYAYRNKTFKNAAGIPVNKNGVPAIETDKINQNTAQKINVAVNTESRDTVMH